MARNLDFSSANAGYNTPYGVYPFYGGITVTGDGKIFAQTAQHGNGVATMYQGQALYVVNATSGQSLWNMTGWFNQGALANGIWVTQNNYDNQIYAFAKGPSATTVDAPSAAITQGSSLVIRGTVTDISAGTKQDDQATRFPNGVPAVSDESMSAWMEYVYMQKPKPTNATGVPVSLDIIDANNNYRNIGITTSDANGFYSFEWQPDIAGKYTVIATFAGSESYWQSHAETAFTVSEPAPTQTPTIQPVSVVDTYFVPAVVAIIVVIIIVGVILAVLMLRKRPTTNAP